MEPTYTHGKIFIENKVITSLDEFVLDFTHIFKERIDNVLLKKFMKALHVRGDKYGIEV